MKNSAWIDPDLRRDLHLLAHVSGTTLSASDGWFTCSEHSDCSSRMEVQIINNLKGD